MAPRFLVLTSAVLMLAYGIAGRGRQWMVRLDGVGPLKVGMTLHQLSTALNENFSLPKDKDEQGCFYVNPSEHPKLSFMILDGRLARVEVDERGMPTSEGIQVGDVEADAQRAYGDKLKITPRAYTAPEGHYLTVRSRDGAYGIRFETDHGKIVKFYAGRADAIQFVEGCQ